jgi:hypothetical protein
MRRCILHVGTHKTATTSIQQILTQHPRELLQDGWVYPLAGRPDTVPTGHHNLAWEITGDGRFLAECGDREALLREICVSDQNIILSSEDFECSVHHTEGFGRLVRGIRERSIEINVIVYLRNQIDLAESLYITLVRLGYERSFRSFCDEILESGRVCWRQWIFLFRYDLFIATLMCFAPEKIIVRSFDHPPGGSPVSDFFSSLGLAELAKASQHAPRHNERPALAESARSFFGNRAGRLLLPAETDAITASLLEAGTGRTPMSLAYQRQFAEAFADSNDAVCAGYELPCFDRMQPGGFASPPGPTLDEIFEQDFADDAVTRYQRHRAGRDT